MKILYSILLVFLFFTACITDEPKGGNLGPGDSLPNFSVKLSDGQTWDNTSLSGKIGVIVFFNTGCPDCQKELPVIQELWNQYQGNNSVIIIPIAREQETGQIENYWNEEGFTMPFSPQSSREIYSLFASSGIPRIYISDKSGVIVYTYDDKNMPSFVTLSDNISSLL